MTDDLEQRIVWLLGTPRSGSTWLLQMLARATGGCAVREPLIGAHLGLSLGGLLGLPVPDDPTLADAMAERPPYFFSKESESAWRPALRTLLLERIAHETERLDHVDGPVIVKEPWGAGGASLILETLPQSRLLFLVRDGRDVVDSFLDGADDGWISTAYGVQIDDRPRTLREMAAFWARSVCAVQRAYEHHPTHLRLAVRYETLCADTACELERTVNWLDSPTDTVAEVAEALQFANTPDAAQGPGKFLRAGTSGLWHEHFTADEKAVLDEVMGPALRSFGYR